MAAYINGTVCVYRLSVIYKLRISKNQWNQLTFVEGETRFSLVSHVSNGLYAHVIVGCLSSCCSLPLAAIGSLDGAVGVWDVAVGTLRETCHTEVRCTLCSCKRAL